MPKNILSILFLIAFATSIKAKPPNDLKSFYFPYQNFFKTKIYKYVDKNNANNIQYWLMKTEIVKSDTILTTKLFDVKLKHIETFREKIKFDGSVMLEFTMVNNRTLSKTKTIDTLVYNWQLPVGEEIKWSVHYQSNYGYENFSKTREFVSIAENKVFKNKNFFSIKFKDTFLVKVQTNQGSDSYSFYQYSYYAKDLGMIEYERFIPDDTTIHYYLDEILSLKKWNKLKNKN